MATITIEETPTGQIVNSAPRESTDTRGRVIRVRRMNALDRLRLFEVAGAENAKNDAYMNYAVIACHVSAIDGDAVTRPATKAQLEALVQRLDEDGLVAAMTATAALYEAAADPDALLKNA